MIKTALILLIFFASFTLLRIILGPTIWDRLLGFNLLSSKIIVAIALYALLTDKSYILDISILYALLGFVSIVFIARFIKRKGDI